MVILKAIAIDDEPPALAVLEHHCKKIPFVELKATFLSASEALRYLHTNPVDIVFADIEMPELGGTDLARMILPLGKTVIFCTAHSQYAVEGYEVQAFDFLVKPIGYNRFLQACNRAFEKNMKDRGEHSGIFVKDGYDWVRVNLGRVTHIQSDSNLLSIYQTDGARITTRMTMRDMTNMLPRGRFIRVHKSFLVSIDAIQKIERHQLTVGKFHIPIAESYRDEVEKLFLKR